MIGCLCIHGFTGGPYELEPLVQYLKKYTDWKIDLPCLPGHDNNSKLSSVSFKEWIEVAESKLVQLLNECDKIYLIGFSMGGMIASYLAAEYNVNKLVLLSPSRRYVSLKQKSIDLGQDIKLGFLGKKPARQPDRPKKSLIPVKAVGEFLKCMRFTRPALKQINCPVLIAQGLQDGTVPYKSTHYLDKEIPVRAEVLYFYDSKHHLCLGPDKEVLFEKVYLFLN